ncbi:Mycolic acid cyclopropane synthetase-domain-containing protein [Multifurca ochricompacta]|uniref:Mycolic acid cyclopropane synthetase-domain-containing protein n=1 Tax=Multifurca ochricompacta TaxID=376703 RepID=A0AAD4M3B2_9AGAM|nr:Mycolic acid cyclopropane synthetase-domain-containing protein [Multifurca ochricompacta]
MAPPLIARSSILTALQRAINVGYLGIEESGVIYHFGCLKKGASHVYITVLKDSFWTRVFLRGDLGFSEAYIFGDIKLDSDNLEGVMNLWLENESGMACLTSVFKRFCSALSGLTNALFGQTLIQARLNVVASYDQSNELFKAFLSKDLMFSCALWSDEEGGVQGDLVPRLGRHDVDLEKAQLRKIHHILRKARVKPGQRILEIGSGWGALAIEAARTYGCEVDTLTLSIGQKKLADERIRDAGLQDYVRVHLTDYREIPFDYENKFDTFISIEMLEHVGPKYYKTYFKIMDKALKSTNATAVVTCSTFPELRYSGCQAEDFMRKYIWPNSCLPSATVLISAVNTASQGRFTLEGVENHSSHYPRTLREWDKRFVENVTPEVLAKDFPCVAGNPAAFEAFRKKWRYLFAYAGAGMARGYLTCHMLTFIRAGDRPLE